MVLSILSARDQRPGTEKETGPGRHPAKGMSSITLNLAFAVAGFLLLAALLRRRKRRELSVQRLVSHSVPPFVAAAQRPAGRRS